MTTRDSEATAISQAGGGPTSLKQVSHATRMKEAALRNLFLACACVAVLAVVLIFVFTFWKAAPVLSQIGLDEFLSLDWAPTSGHYGILALLAGSAIVTVGSLAIGVPLAVGCAVFLTEIAGRKVAGVVGTAVDLLAGVPSVVFGFFGLVVLRPLVAGATGGLGFGALTVWLVLAVMIVPTITTLTMDALRSIPMGVREASFAMGATRWQTIYKVVLPAARMGIVNAVVLGMGRAIGETMAVLMVVGNAPVIPAGIASPLSTLTSQIALDMGYSSGLHRSALFGMGVVLFLISAALVGIVRMVSAEREGAPRLVPRPRLLRRARLPRRRSLSPSRARLSTQPPRPLPPRTPRPPWPPLPPPRAAAPASSDCSPRARARAPTRAA